VNRFNDFTTKINILRPLKSNTIQKAMLPKVKKATYARSRLVNLYPVIHRSDRKGEFITPRT